MWAIAYFGTIFIGLLCLAIFLVGFSAGYALSTLGTLEMFKANNLYLVGDKVIFLPPAEEVVESVREALEAYMMGAPRVD